MRYEKLVAVRIALAQGCFWLYFAGFSLGFSECPPSMRYLKLVAVRIALAQGCCYSSYILLAFVSCGVPVLSWTGTMPHTGENRLLQHFFPNGSDSPRLRI